MTDNEYNTTLKMGDFGDDAEKWAKAFMNIAKKNNWTLHDITEGLMICWFAGLQTRLRSHMTPAHRIAPIQHHNRPISPYYASLMIG